MILIIISIIIIIITIIIIISSSSSVPLITSSLPTSNEDKNLSLVISKLECDSFFKNVGQCIDLNSNSMNNDGDNNNDDELVVLDLIMVSMTPYFG